LTVFFSLNECSLAEHKRWSGVIYSDVQNSEI